MLDVWNNYSIDGDQLQWLVCALYECCRRPSVEGMTEHVDNIYISLTRLLSAAKMSMVQIRKWADMVEMSDDMRDRIERLERQFAVSSVIFRNFGRAFSLIINVVNPIHEDPLSPTALDLFRFTWVTFVKVRANFPAVTDDLVNSYHLLACLLDWILGIAMLTQLRRDLINLEFRGLPKDFVLAVASKRPWQPSLSCSSLSQDGFVTLPCLLRYICEDNDVNYVECKTVKEHFFRPYMYRLVEKDLRTEGLQSLFSSPETFEAVFQTLNNHYEEYIIGTGDFDERIYLSPNAAEEIGSIRRHSERRLPSKHLMDPIARALSTYTAFGDLWYSDIASDCVTGRLNGNANFKNAEVRSQNLHQLHTMLLGRLNGPSEALTSLLEAHCSSAASMINELAERLKGMSNEFVHAYSASTPAGTSGNCASAVGDTLASGTGGPVSTMRSETGESNIGEPDAADLLPSASIIALLTTAAEQRVQLAQTLYWAGMEAILVDEMKRLERKAGSGGTAISNSGSGGAMTMEQDRKPNFTGCGIMGEVFTI
ncbi:unnamed protein product [Protopolystoma xenopodis]|uniref:Retinoblastoma-associated protein N-terminal domain-containing protein n=1 Tax=Protopolystoma xenopodis TaxID=117903 RepID=A0A3S4ZCK4_9PLAT|nr:unnamed protein product [Protopolystoma xenopodis]